MKKPPAALADGGLGAAFQLSGCQASFPARALEPVIRMECLGAAVRWTKETFALAPEVCMTLIEVKQRSKGCVKTECSAAEVIDSPVDCPIDTGTTTRAFEQRKFYIS